MKTLKQLRLTLKFNEKLNPKIWSNNKLKPLVKKKLIEIGDAWSEYANIPSVAIEDYVLVGGMAGYNYTEFSDIDLHIIVDKGKISQCEKLLDDYLKDKKELWSLRDISIYGHDVELYAQDTEDEFITAQGVYSINKDKWLQEPEKVSYEDKELLKDTSILKKVLKYEDYINHLIDGESNNLEILNKIKDKIKKMRGDSLAKSGEYGEGNIIFKELRNRGILDKMNSYMKSIEDQLLSLESYDIMK